MRDGGGPRLVSGPPLASHREELEEPVIIPRASWEWLEALPLATACVMETSSMKKVPTRCESIFARCCLVAMRRIISHPHDELGWKLFLCVPSLLLGVPASGGKGLTALVRRRCERFLLGEWSHLAPTSWRDSAERVAAGGGREVVGSEARGRQVPSTSLTEARAMSDAVALVGQAQLSRAMRRLEVAVLCPPTEEVFQALQALHPPRSGLFPAPTPEVEPPPIEILQEVYDETMARLPAATAPGTSQMRYEHLRSVHLHGGDIHLYQVCCLIAAGRVPVGIRPWLAGARLVALCKDGKPPPPDGPVRPIACGESLRRLCGRIVSTQMAPRFSSYFARPPEGEERITPVQLGVAVPGGSDIMVHTLQSAMELHPEWAFASVDIKNAFNSVSRSVMADRVLLLFPELWSFIDVCYGRAPHLSFGVRDEEGVERRRTISSAEGTQQGDPLGPFLFSLVFHVVLERLVREHPDIRGVDAYFDDGWLYGPPDVVCAALRWLFREIPALIGAEVRMDKCRVFSPAGDLSMFPEEVEGARDTLLGVVVLGVPVGTDQYVTDQLREIVAGHTDCVLRRAERRDTGAEPLAGAMERLTRLSDPQVACALLGHCAHPRVAHLLRGVKPALARHVSVMPRFHDAIVSVLAGPEAGVARGEPFSPRARRLAALPPRIGGGAGLTSGARVAPAAWAGSWAQSWFLMRKLHPLLLGHVRLTPASQGTLDPPAEGYLASVLTAHSELHRLDDHIREARSHDITLPRGSPGPSTTFLHPVDYDARSHTRSQSSYADVVHTHDWIHLRASLTDPRERAWFTSCGFRSIGAEFMRAIPSFGPFRLSPAEFPVAVRHHFMETQPVVAGVSTCGDCHHPMGPRPDAIHYIECRGGGSWFGRFHDALEAQVFRMVAEVFPGQGRVQTQDYYSHGYSPSYIPDISVFDYDGLGSTLVVEVSIYRPTCDTHLPIACGEPGAASAAVEARRRAGYRSLPPGTHWRPFIVDTFGHMSPGTHAFLGELARLRGDALGTQGAVAPDHTMSWSSMWRQRLSMTMARQAAQIITRRARTDYPLQMGAASMP